MNEKNVWPPKPHKHIWSNSGQCLAYTCTEISFKRLFYVYRWTMAIVFGIFLFFACIPLLFLIHRNVMYLLIISSVLTVYGNLGFSDDRTEKQNGWKGQYK